MGTSFIAIPNHKRIQAEFHKRTFWVCVSDQDKNQFNIKAILAKIYKLAKDEKNIGDLDLDPLVRELRNILDQNKYLLVLDDVRAKDRIKCNELLDILIGSSHVANKGSRIVVTTLSKKSAAVMRCNHPYELQGLSDEDSWLLFKITSGMEQENLHDWVKMGKDIVKKCANVPLAIAVVGSFLYGQNEDTWRCIQQRGLSATRKDETSIVPILKFSYDQLSPSLKSCFIYSAMFPKDTEREKEILTSLWIAQGYVKDEGQGIEAAAEYYFNVLVQRCFFQDIDDDGDEGMITFKIHDLMHDMAHQAVGKEIFIAGSTTSNLGKHIRHLFDAAPQRRAKGFITKSKIHSYTKDDKDTSDSIRFPLSALLTNWRSLRALGLAELCITELPNAIGELLHLRALDLSGNVELKRLPESFTKLINLQTLLLLRCNKLSEDFTKLINLKTLHVSCGEEDGLRYMPSDMEKMTCLIRLNRFIVSQRKSCTKREARLEDLRVPRNLKGYLKIYISPSYKHSKRNGGGGGYLCNTEHLNAISIKWPHGQHEEERKGNDDDDVLEDLQPHSNLKALEIKRHPGLRIPRWAREQKTG